MKIQISEIVTGDRLRDIDMDRVNIIAESMEAIGLLSPILVRPDRRLVAGAHRLEAARLLGWTEIDAREYDGPDIAEVVENLARKDLDLAQRIDHERRWRDYMSAQNPEAFGHGGDRRSSRKHCDLKRPSLELAQATGSSERTIQDNARIGDALGDGLRLLFGTRVGNRRRDLDRLSRIEPAWIREKAIAEINEKDCPLLDAIPAIKCSDVIVRKREESEDWPFIELMAASIVDLAGGRSQGGVISPIFVNADGSLIDGLQRLRACEMLGRETIPCIYVDVDYLRAQAMEIELNIRAPLHWTEREDLEKRRAEILEIKQRALEATIDDPKAMEKHWLHFQPEMAADQFESFKASIAKGYNPLFPIVIYEGAILDGWERYRACMETGVEPVMIQFEGTDEEALEEIRVSEIRMNLSDSQRAIIAVEYEKLQERLRIRQPAGQEGGEPMP